MASGAARATNGRTLPVYVIHAGDAFLASEALRRIIADVLGHPPDITAISDHDGESSSLELSDVLDDLRTPSLLSPLRLVIVRSAEDFVRKHRESLEDYLNAPSPGGVLVLVVESWPRTTRLYKLIDRIGETVVCEAMKPAAAIGWVTERAANVYRCRISPDAARRLADLIGTACGQLDSELAKLATFVAPRSDIALADVEELVGAHRADKVFAIADAVARNDSATALRQWHQLLETDRDAPYRAVGGLAWAFRRFVQAKRMVEQGVPVDAVKRQLNVFVDTPAFQRQLGRFSLRAWEDHLRALLDADVASKSGLGTAETAVEKLIVRMCAAG